MSYLDESNIQDLVDQVTQFQDDVEEKQSLLDNALFGIQEFLLKPTKPEDYKLSKRLFQFEFKNQTIWFKHKIIVDQHLMHIYPVVEKLVETLFTGTRAAMTGQKRAMVGEAAKPNENPNQPSQQVPPSQGVLEKLRGAISGRQSIEEQLDPWKGNYDLMEEAKAYPKTWRTLNRLHAANMIRAKKFPGLKGQQDLLQIEWYYMTSRVEPSISTMIERSRQILRDSDTERVANILSQYYQNKEKHRMDIPPA